MTVDTITHSKTLLQPDGSSHSSMNCCCSFLCIQKHSCEPRVVAHLILHSGRISELKCFNFFKKIPETAGSRVLSCHQVPSKAAFTPSFPKTCTSYKSDLNLIQMVIKGKDMVLLGKRIPMKPWPLYQIASDARGLKPQGDRNCAKSSGSWAPMGIPMSSYWSQTDARIQAIPNYLYAINHSGSA